MKVHSKGWLLLAAIAVIAAAAAATGGLAIAGSTDNPAAAKGLGPLTGLLPRDHLTVESALQVDLSKESVRLPLYKGKANGETVWYVLVDASDQGIANDLGINYSPKLGNMGKRLRSVRKLFDLDLRFKDMDEIGDDYRQIISLPNPPIELPFGLEDQRN